MNTEFIFIVSFWTIFIIGYYIDFRVTGGKKFHITVRKALMWTFFWIAIALIYDLMIYLYYPQNTGQLESTAHLMSLKFLAGYLTEKSLSVDNLFVFILIFVSMKTHPSNQVKLLKLGILLSIILRISFIAAGLELVNRFHFVFYVFGAILVFTAIRMLISKGQNEESDPTKNTLCRLASKFIPIDPTTSHFFMRKEGRLHMGYSFLTLLVIASTDVLFATDSIPAIIGIIREGASNHLTLPQENFLAISSNVFAVMGLASLFFAIRGIIKKFRYLKTGVFIILLFIGIKMLVSDFPMFSEWVDTHHWLSFAVIASALSVSILASVFIPEKAREVADSDSELT